MNRAVLYALLFVAGTAASADVLTLTSGSKIECTVISEGERITFRKGSSTFSLPREQVVSIRRDAPPTARPADASRLPSAEEVLAALGRQTWVTNIEQIPATVIDKGVLKNVPYTSHRAGDYEINVYGNPDAPACVEIGIYRQLLDDPAAKQQCVAFMSSLLGKERAAALAKLNREKDAVTVGDWTLEITPPTDEDAYGGWWVSVYGQRPLETSRASAEEMRSITVARASAGAGERPAREATLAASGRTAGGDPGQSDDWTPTEMSRARRPAAGVTSSGGGRVYVRGYTRKDGTYVHAHSRSTPGRGGRR